MSEHTCERDCTNSVGNALRGVPERQRRRTLQNVALIAVILSAFIGCHQDMYDGSRLGPLEPSPFFADGQSARPRVPGTVAQGELHLNDALYTGKTGGELVMELPMPVTQQLLERGQERFNIYCSVCHGQAGNGDGMIVQRGFRRPPSYHIPRLRGVPVGHLFDVMTHGFGAMPDYAHQISPEDRWAIAAYIRALQLSQFADVSELAAEDQRALEAREGE